MRKPLNEPVLFIAGLASVIIGALLVASAAGALGKAQSRMARTEGFMSELKLLDEQSSGFRDLGVQLRATGSPSIQQLEGLLADHLPGASADSRAETRREVSSQWAIRDLRMALTDVSVGRLMAFVHAAESLRPPWQMSGCEVNATPGAPGRGTVELTFSSLEHVP